MQHRQEAFSEDRLKELSKDPTKVIYQPTYDTIFEPWSSRRVETAVRRIVRIAMGSADAEAARAVCERDAELKAFSELYQKFYEKFTTPSIAQNPEHVHVAMEMIRRRRWWRVTLRQWRGWRRPGHRLRIARKSSRRQSCLLLLSFRLLGGRGRLLELRRLR